MISISDVAKTFLTFESMSPKKLQKLCYYAQAWYLALNNEPLVDSVFEAWIHGPVSPELYHSYKVYGYNKIPKSKDIPSSIKDDSYILSFIKHIYDIYGGFSGNTLENLTHNELPWLNARGNLETWQSSNRIISNEDMQCYYYTKYCSED